MYVYHSVCIIYIVCKHETTFSSDAFPFISLYLSCSSYAWDYTWQSGFCISFLFMLYLQTYTLSHNRVLYLSPAYVLAPCKNLYILSPTPPQLSPIFSLSYFQPCPLPVFSYSHSNPSPTLFLFFLQNVFTFITYHFYSLT